MRFASCGSWLAIAVLAVALSGCVFTFPSKKDARLAACQTAQGLVALELKNYDQSRYSFGDARRRAERAADEEESDCAEDWLSVAVVADYMEARAYAEQGKLDLAASNMQHVAAKAKPPLQALARLRAGHYLLALGKRDAAKDEFRRAAWNSFGNKGEYKDQVPAWLVDEARTEYEKLLK